MIESLIKEEKDDEALIKLKDEVIQRDDDLTKVQAYIATEFDGEYDVLDSLENTNNYKVKLQLSQKFIASQSIKDNIKVLKERQFKDNSLIFALIHSVL